jgi:hypothetical protein
MVTFTAFIAVVWCYQCSPQAWITDDHRYKTRAECEHYINVTGHYTSSSWDAEAKDKLRYTKHKAWCLPAVGEPN